MENYPKSVQVKKQSTEYRKQLGNYEHIFKFYMHKILYKIVKKLIPFIT
jgi:hypothetical protein